MALKQKIFSMFIFFRAEENEPKEGRPCPGVILRVDDTAGARGNSLRSNSPRTFIRSHPRCSAPAQRGTANTYHQQMKNSF